MSYRDYSNLTGDLARLIVSIVSIVSGIVLGSIRNIVLRYMIDVLNKSGVLIRPLLESLAYVIDILSVIGTVLAVLGIVLMIISILRIAKQLFLLSNNDII